MCVKISPKDLNLGPCPPYPISTTCKVTITLRVCGDGLDRYLKQATMSMSMSMDGGEDKKDD